MPFEATTEVVDLIKFVEQQHAALIHELSVALGQGPGCKPEGGHGPFPAVMTAQPFADRDPDALTEGDPHELGKCGDVLCSNLKEDHLSKDQQGDTMTSGNEPLRSSESHAQDAPEAPRATSSRNLKNLLMAPDENGEPSSPCWWLQRYMDSITMILVVANTLIWMAEAQYEGEAFGRSVPQDGPPDAAAHMAARHVFGVLDFLFDFFFLIELGTQLVSTADYLSFAKVEIFGMISMALLSLVEMGLFLCQWSGLRISDDVFHYVHAAACFRSLRCLRTLAHFKGPQLLLKACQSFLNSLFWAMIFLSIFMTSSALALANTLFTYYGSSASIDDRIWIWQRYGTTFRSLYSLFELTFSGSWPSQTRPLIEKVHAGLVLFFVIYITTVAFGIIRVITAVFLRDTLDAAASDAEEQVAAELKKRKEYAGKLEEIFAAIDSEGNGVLTEGQLIAALEYPKIRAYLQTLELDVFESKALFHILDDGDGTVTLKEFIDGLLRCKGQARAIDQVATHTEIKHSDKKINKILSILDPKHSKGGDPTFNLPASTLRTATNLADFSGAAGGCESSFDFSYFDHPFVSPTTSLRRSIRAASPAYAW